jgi:hypothetical protein
LRSEKKFGGSRAQSLVLWRVLHEGVIKVHSKVCVPGVSQHEWDSGGTVSKPVSQLSHASWDSAKKNAQNPFKKGCPTVPPLIYLKNGTPNPTHRANPPTPPLLLRGGVVASGTFSRHCPKAVFLWDTCRARRLPDRIPKVPPRRGGM